jgi:hypothetical protein
MTHYHRFFLLKHRRKGDGSKLPSSFSSQTQRRQNTQKNNKKKPIERKELTFFLSLLHLGWNTPLAFSSPWSFNVELSTFLSLVSHVSLKLCAT